MPPAVSRRTVVPTAAYHRTTGGVELSVPRALRFCRWCFAAAIDHDTGVGGEPPCRRRLAGRPKSVGPRAPNARSVDRNDTLVASDGLVDAAMTDVDVWSVFKVSHLSTNCASGRLALLGFSPPPAAAEGGGHVGVLTGRQSAVKHNNVTPLTVLVTFVVRRPAGCRRPSWRKVEGCLNASATEPSDRPLHRRAPTRCGENGAARIARAGVRC